MHTPGPWRYLEVTQTIYTGKPGPDDRLEVAEFRTAPTAENAALIAEAPAMLEALKRFVAAQRRAETSASLDGLADIAEALIAKVEGR